MKLQSAAIARSINLIKISLWIRNLGSISAVTRVIEPTRNWAKTIFKIRQSVGLFTFLLMGGSNVNTANRNLSWTGANQLGIFQKSVCQLGWTWTFLTKNKSSKWSWLDLGPSDCKTSTFKPLGYPAFLPCVNGGITEECNIKITLQSWRKVCLLESSELLGGKITVNVWRKSRENWICLS